MPAEPLRRSVRSATSYALKPISKERFDTEICEEENLGTIKKTIAGHASEQVHTTIQDARLPTFLTDLPPELLDKVTDKIGRDGRKTIASLDSKHNAAAWQAQSGDAVTARTAARLSAQLGQPVFHDALEAQYLVTYRSMCKAYDLAEAAVDPSVRLDAMTQVRALARDLGKLSAAEKTFGRWLPRASVPVTNFGGDIPAFLFGNPAGRAHCHLSRQNLKRDIQLTQAALVVKEVQKAPVSERAQLAGRIASLETFLAFAETTTPVTRTVDFLAGTFKVREGKHREMRPGGIVGFATLTPSVFSCGIASPVTSAIAQGASLMGAGVKGSVRLSALPFAVMREEIAKKAYLRDAV